MDEKSLCLAINRQYVVKYYDIQVIMNVIVNEIWESAGLPSCADTLRGISDVEDFKKDERASEREAEI